MSDNTASDGGVGTVVDLLLARSGDQRTGLRFGEERWTWDEHVRASASRAAWLRSLHDPSRPFHVGLLADNVPEFSFLLGAAAHDIRHYGATYFNYVGKPLSYILAVPPRPDDADNPLRIAFGNEGADRDLARFADRFGCEVSDGFGSTEGGVGVQRTEDTPLGSIGRPGPGITILDPDTGLPCPPARFDDHGVVQNADEAIGELVNTEGAGAFEGYYKNPEAERERMRGGCYWSGDLAYADERGFYYFAGRSLDWLRVDGENFGAAPVERVLLRHPDVVLAAVYAGPAADVAGPSSTDPSATRSAGPSRTASPGTAG